MKKDLIFFAPVPLVGFFRRKGAIRPDSKFIYMVRHRNRRDVKMFGVWMLN